MQTEVRRKDGIASPALCPSGSLSNGSEIQSDTMASWKYLEKLQFYDIGIDPLLHSNYPWALLLVLVALGFSLLQPKSSNESIDAPIVGPERSWIGRLKFFLEAGRLVNEGDNKVRQPMQNHQARCNPLSVQEWSFQAQRK